MERSGFNDIAELRVWAFEMIHFPLLFAIFLLLVGMAVSTQYTAVSIYSRLKERHAIDRERSVVPQSLSTIRRPREQSTRHHPEAVT